MIPEISFVELKHFKSNSRQWRCICHLNESLRLSELLVQLYLQCPIVLDIWQPVDCIRRKLNGVWCILLAPLLFACMDNATFN